MSEKSLYEASISYLFSIERESTGMRVSGENSRRMPVSSTTAIMTANSSGSMHRQSR